MAENHPPECLTADGEKHAAQPRLSTSNDPFDSAEEFGETSLESSLALAQAAMQRGDLNEAANHFRTVVELRPDWLFGLLGMGVLCLSAGQTNEAVSAFRRAAALLDSHAPEAAFVFKSLAKACFRSGDTSAAVENLQEALAHSPLDQDAMLDLAAACHAGGLSALGGQYLENILLTVSTDTKALRLFSPLSQKLSHSDLERRAMECLRSIERTFPSPESSPMLKGVNLEITTLCNLRCTGCFRTIRESKGEWNNRQLGLPDFRRILDRLPHTHYIALHGIGEPSLNPNLPDMVHAAQESGKLNHIGIITNALAKDVDYFTRLFDCGLSSMTISVDSLDPELVGKVRAGTNTETLKDRIRTLARCHPGRIGISTTVGLQNISSIPSLLNDLNLLGRLDVNMKPFDDMGDPRGCLSLEERVWFVHKIRETTGSFSNLRVNTAHFIPSSDICRRPWHNPYITVEGWITPCCRLTDPAEITYGNLLTNSFEEAWNSPTALSWREHFLQTSPKMCLPCPIHIQRKRLHWESPTVAKGPLHDE